jgi:hypothetical protein
LQERIRLRASHPPFIAPYFLIASALYAEQVGVYRHEGGVNGEINNWYILMINKKTSFKG